jgi:hypothetical protein
MCRAERSAAKANPYRDGFITPRGVGDDMMQRLMHMSRVVWSQSRGHGLDGTWPPRRTVLR